jgi:hypothetical protein
MDGNGDLQASAALPPEKQDPFPNEENGKLTLRLVWTLLDWSLLPLPGIQPRQIGRPVIA